MKKILVLEKTEITKESIVIVKNNLKETSKDVKKINDPDKAATNQTQSMTRRTRRKVTTCLYRSPNNRARSLSTLMAVDVKIVTSINKGFKKLTTSPVIEGNEKNIAMAKIGCIVKPTQRSVTARHWNNNFVGG